MRLGGRKPDPRLEAAKALQAIRLARMRLSRATRVLEASSKNDPTLRRNLEVLYKLDYILERIAVKLEVFVATGLAPLNSIAAAASLAKAASALAASAPPEVAAEIMEVEEGLLRALRLVGGEGISSVFEADIEIRDNPEAREVLKEAERIAQRRVGESLGEG